MNRSTVALWVVGTLLMHMVSENIVTSAPIFLWKRSPLTDVSGKSDMVVSYEVTSDINALVLQVISKTTGAKIVSSDDINIEALDKLLSAGQTDLVTIYVGSQLYTGNFRKASYSSSSDKLQKVLSEADSSLYLPLSSSKGMMYALFEAELASRDIPFKSISCASATSDLASEVQNAMANSEPVKVLIICPNVNTDIDLSKELNDVELIEKTITSMGLSNLFIYTSKQEETSFLEIPQRRNLLGLIGFGQYTVCDTLCQTQVRWLEGILAAIVLALASLAGLCCLNVLDTPTRFEAPKDNQ